MNKKEIKLIILGFFIGVVFTLVLVRISDLQTKVEDFSEDDLINEYIDQNIDESMNSATESSMSTDKEPEINIF
jgi:hypothetical protein